jgi:hypothetical protein
MIPFPELAVELILGLGAALFVANLVAVMRPWILRKTSGREVPSPPSKLRVFLNMGVGLVAAVWALATLLVRS